MKSLAAMMMLGILASGNAMAVDYSVGIVNLGSGAESGGSALNVYEIKKTGITLIQTYVLQQNDFTGHLASPLTLAMSPAHNFVYVAYTGESLPNIVGFSITSTGLVYQWEDVLETGDGGLQGTTLTAGPDYVLETTYPFGSAMHVVSQAGIDLLDDYDNGGSGIYTVSGSVDWTRTFYYSCRSTAYESTPPTSVSVYRFENGVDVSTGTSSPVGTATDPVFIQSVCN